MPTQFIAKQSATSKIKAGDAEDAGIGVVSGDLYVHDGVAARKVADAADLPVAGIAAGYKIKGGQVSIDASVAATADVITGLATIVAVKVSLDSDPSDNAAVVSATIGDQAGAPAAGTFTAKVFKFTNAATDVTPTASTTGTHKVNWIAVGT